MEEELHFSVPDFHDNKEFPGVAEGNYGGDHTENLRMAKAGDMICYDCVLEFALTDAERSMLGWDL